MLPLATGTGSFECDPELVWRTCFSWFCEWHIIPEEVAQYLELYERNGLLFCWTENGRTYGYWAGIDKPGRLPPKSQINRGDTVCGPVPPQNDLRAYLRKHRWIPGGEEQNPVFLAKDGLYEVHPDGPVKISSPLGNTSGSLGEPKETTSESHVSPLLGLGSGLGLGFGRGLGEGSPGGSPKPTGEERSALPASREEQEQPPRLVEVDGVLVPAEPPPGEPSEPFVKIKPFVELRGETNPTGTHVSEVGVLPKNEIDEAGKNKALETRPGIDTAQDLVPWMEKSWREHQQTHKFPWPKVLYPNEFLGQEQRLGAKRYRRAWLRYLAKAERPSPFEFVKKHRASGSNPRPQSGKGALHSDFLRRHQGK
jgi:hypothetical protein